MNPPVLWPFTFTMPQVGWHLGQAQVKRLSFFLSFSNWNHIRKVFECWARSPSTCLHRSSKSNIVCNSHLCTGILWGVALTRRIHSRTLTLQTEFCPTATIDRVLCTSPFFGPPLLGRMHKGAAGLWVWQASLPSKRGCFPK